MRIELSWNLKIRRNTNTARLLRRYGLALRLTGCFGAIFAATVAVGLEDSGNLVWVANGLLLSYLLLAPKWLWKITTPELPKSLIERNMCLAVDLDDASLLSQCVGKTKHPQVFLRRVEELYANPEAEDQCQVELKDGRTLERYSTSLRNENGEYLGRVWFFRDITQRKSAEQELRNAYRALEQLATTDALTRLANRRSFDQHLGSEWRRGMREQLPLSLLIIDVDWFKSYNDTYGHPRGDKCLKQIAAAALDVVTRPGDLVARIGGEEFAVILPNTPAAGAIEVAKQICAAVCRRRMPHNTNPVRYVTISAGCASILPAPGHQATILMQRADKALYAAKHGGRNQVCSAEQLPQGKPALYAS
jgi:diguanylate cyclase (GGDEF)-like protein